MDSSSDLQALAPSCSGMSSKKSNRKKCRETNYHYDINISSDNEDLNELISDDNLCSSDVESVISEEGVKKSNSSLRSCRAVGKKCMKHLKALEKKIVARLERVHKHLELIHYKLDNSTKIPDTRISNWFIIFGIPYFKDRRYFPCPPNEDTLKKRANKELILVDLRSTKMWMENHKKLLKDAIHEEEINRQVKQLKTKMNSIRNNLEEKNDVTEIQNLNSSLKELELRIAVIKNKSLEEVIGFSDSEYDWMKISVQVLNGDFTVEECRAMWHNYLHPKIHKREWLEEEDNRLIKLAKLYRYQDWDKLAEELGTNRSGYQCICHLQGRLNQNNSPRRKWSTKEDDMLKALVEKFRVGSYIPWSKIAAYMDNHSKTQIFSRWSYSLAPNIKKGRFTENEDILLVAAIRRFGTDNFHKVTRFLPGRTATQARERYNTLIKSTDESFQWNPEEDKKLLDLVEEHGKGNWTTITKHFPNRTRSQLRLRYSTIQNYLKKTQSCRLTELSKIHVPSHQKKGDPNRVDKTWNKLQNILKDVKTSEDLNEENMLELRDKFCGKEKKKRPGRRIGQTKPLNDFDEQFASIFRCTYSQIGGRKKTLFNEEDITKRTESMTLMLKHFQAQLNVPENDDEIGAKKNFFSELDRAVLCKIRDENLLEKCSKDCPIHYTVTDVGGPTDTVSSLSDVASATSELPSSSCSEVLTDINYMLPPNYTSLVGFRTLLLSRKNLLEMCRQNEDLHENEPPDSPRSDCLSVEDAETLWHNRFFSLFCYPALMSRFYSSKDTNLEDMDDGYVNSIVNSNSSLRESKAKKYKYTGKKKRKPVNKKEEKSHPPVKKRKYERTGKHKKPVVMPPETEWRRSSRHKPSSDASNTEKEERSEEGVLTQPQTQKEVCEETSLTQSQQKRRQKSILTHPQNKKSQESVQQQPQMNGGQESVLTQPQMDGSKESVLIQPQNKGSQESVLTQPQKNGIDESLLTQSKSNGSQESVLIQQHKDNGEKSDLSQPNRNGSQQSVLSQLDSHIGQEPFIPSLQADEDDDNSPMGCAQQ